MTARQQHQKLLAIPKNKRDQKWYSKFHTLVKRISIKCPSCKVEVEVEVFCDEPKPILLCSACDAT